MVKIQEELMTTQLGQAGQKLAQVRLANTKQVKYGCLGLYGFKNMYGHVYFSKGACTHFIFSYDVAQLHPTLFMTQYAYNCLCYFVVLQSYLKCFTLMYKIVSQFKNCFLKVSFVGLFYTGACQGGPRSRVCACKNPKTQKC